jgi:hypothetical protein
MSAMTNSLAAHVTAEATAALFRIARASDAPVRERVEALLWNRVSAVMHGLDPAQCPAEGDLSIHVEGGTAAGAVACQLVIRNPERYPQLVQRLAEAGLVDAKG